MVGVLPGKWDEWMNRAPQKLLCVLSRSQRWQRFDRSDVACDYEDPFVVGIRICRREKESEAARGKCFGETDSRFAI
jgi:hypothetical protein